ncbi:lycopene cyclase domain-containing protein [Ferruginibacter sp. SUN106]|uniref:lycopene cyclase domain-containing protein n=1 Tax=Ferruginibacter sp. SUN106 TaxID=2978348 RepID=UPI003D3626BE
MNPHYTYFLILTASLAGPLLLSFDKKVAFYKNWKYLFPAMLLPASLYIVWDFYFTGKGVWHFNENYIIGIKIYNLPIEEVLFFFIVPYCCVFIYECIRTYFPKIKDKATADVILMVLALILWVTGIICYHKYYTSWTFIFNAAFIAIIYAFKKYFKTFDAALFLVSYCVMLIPFLIVNGFLTAIPVVLYNNAENLGLRIYTIPFEDTFYGMLLILMTIVIYENLKSKD